MMKRVPYIDYPRHYEKMRADVMAAVDRVLARGDLMLRADLRDFEEHLAAFSGAKHAIGVGNCSDALRLALLAAGVGAGDEVITVAHTFVATVAAIHMRARRRSWSMLAPTISWTLPRSNKRSARAPRPSCLSISTAGCATWSC
jgi:histidinol-phosphate/aromatic aminotransferase/cobyric acid decarboxylase-like protein